MKRILQSILLAVSIFSSIDAFAGGPLGAVGTQARRYSPSSFPLRYAVDPGPLGSFTNATGVQITNYAFQQWANVRSAQLSFSNIGFLSHDVTSAADPLISGTAQYSDGINPIVFDNDGSITDAKLGAGAHNSVLGFAGSAYSGNNYVEGYAIINGTLSGSATSTDVDRYEAVLTHEIGHFLGLAHSQVAMHSDFATMYPIIEKNAQKFLSPDDTTAIANLYPAATFLSQTGSITGTVKTPSGAILSCVNVIAEDAATGVAYSTVVDYYSGGKSGYDSPPAASGTFTFSGLHPGTYYVRIEPMNASFSGGSSVGSYYTPINTSVAREWWNGASESGNMLTDNTNQHTAVTVSAGVTTSGINFISNESPTLTTLTYHNGNPYYIFTLPQGSIQKYAVRCTAPAKGSLIEAQFRLDPSSVLPSNGLLTVGVYQNAAGSLAGIPGALLGSVTIPYTELATDQYNEIYLGGLGNAVAFDSNATFHIVFSTNGVGSVVFYTDNGSPTQNRTSYQYTTNQWYNFPDGGWGAGYNLIASAIFSKAPATPTVQVLVPHISLSPASLNFGSVNLRATLDQNIRLTNTGTGPLIVTGTSVLGADSLDFAIMAGSGAYTLAAGAYHDYTIRFMPCNTAGPEGPTRSAKLFIASNAGTSPDYVPLVGTAVAPAPLALSPIKFGSVRPGTTSTLTSSIIYNAGLDTLHPSAIRILGMGNDNTTLKLLTTAGAEPVAPDSFYKVAIQFNPRIPKNYVATLRMEHDGLPGYTDVPIYANGAAGVLSTDTAVTINRNTSGNLNGNFVLHNTGNAPLFIRGISITGVKDSIEGPYYQISEQLPLVIKEGDSTELHIFFNPSAGNGDYVGTLLLQTDSYPDTVQTVIIHTNVTALSVGDRAPLSFDFQVTPNPAVSVVTVRYHMNQPKGELTLLDLSGKQLLTKSLDQSHGTRDIDLSGFASGQYYLVLKVGSATQSQKVIIEH